MKLSLVLFLAVLGFDLFFGKIHCLFSLSKQLVILADSYRIIPTENIVTCEIGLNMPNVKVSYRKKFYKKVIE